jgi:hypothetical protein
MRDFLRIAASSNGSTKQPRVSRNRVYVRALALCALLTLGCAANAAVVSYSGPTYAKVYTDPCGNCYYLNPLPTSPNINASVTSPAGTEGIGVQIKSAMTVEFNQQKMYEYTGEIYTFTVDAPIYFNAFLDTSLEVSGTNPGISAFWRLCAGAGSTTPCSNPITGWQAPSTGNGIYSQSGPYRQLGAGTYSVWAYLHNSGLIFGEQWVPPQTSSGTFNVHVSLSSVPIPAAAWLFGSGLVLLGWFRRKANA